MATDATTAPTANLPADAEAPADVEPTGPDPLAAAWWAGWSACRIEANAELRDLEMTITRLESQVADYRAELAAIGR